MAKCIMFKQAYKLGEDLIGIMDFVEGTVPCVQVTLPQNLPGTQGIMSARLGRSVSCVSASSASCPEISDHVWHILSWEIISLLC